MPHLMPSDHPYQQHSHSHLYRSVFEEFLQILGNRVGTEKVLKSKFELVKTKSHESTTFAIECVELTEKFLILLHHTVNIFIQWKI